MANLDGLVNRSILVHFQVTSLRSIKPVMNVQNTQMAMQQG